ncbi:hypothetical protein RND81_13G149300 [Saponaria officinalis]|uniref:Uncharacterized protein n=1 Tax=Saponaria officinalis TaxID=3572 RepID=A0AAW1H441_SAPOF
MFVRTHLIFTQIQKLNISIHAQNSNKSVKHAEYHKFKRKILHLIQKFVRQKPNISIHQQNSNRLVKHARYHKFKRQKFRNYIQTKPHLIQMFVRTHLNLHSNSKTNISMHPQNSNKSVKHARYHKFKRQKS